MNSYSIEILHEVLRTNSFDRFHLHTVLILFEQIEKQFLLTENHLFQIKAKHISFCELVFDHRLNRKYHH